MDKEELDSGEPTNDASSFLLRKDVEGGIRRTWLAQPDPATSTIFFASSQESEWQAHRPALQRPWLAARPPACAAR
jgi:hypothetical protein